MVAALNADCALLNSGTLRSDQLHKAGEFSLRVSNISSDVIFAANNGENNDFSGLAGHPSHDGWPHSPWRLRRDDPQGEEAKLLLLKCSYVEIVENSFLGRAIHIFMRPWTTKTGWQAHLSYVDYFYRACSINMCLWIDFEYQVEDSGLQRSALELML